MTTTEMHRAIAVLREAIEEVEALVGAKLAIINARHLADEARLARRNGELRVAEAKLQAGWAALESA